MSQAFFIPNIFIKTKKMEFYKTVKLQIYNAYINYIGWTVNPSLDLIIKGKNATGTAFSTFPYKRK